MMKNTSQLQETVIPDFHSRGYLPHLENKMLQIITFRLYDSVPREIIEQWKCTLAQQDNTEGSAGDHARNPREEQKKLRRLIDDYEDKGYGQCFFRDDSIAKLMESTLFQYEGRHYRLVRWVIMPNHVHVLIELLPGVSLSTILQEWKSFTSHAANKLLGRIGGFWMSEYYDRYIRDQHHLKRAIEYIDANPVKAGLADTPSSYRWSSAYHENRNWSAGDLARNSATATDGAGEGARAPLEDDKRKGR